MHLQDWAVYRNDPSILRPAFWPEGQTRRVKMTVSDVRTGPPEQRGLNVRNQARVGKVLALLPQGAEVTVSGEGEYRKLESTNGPDILKKPTAHCSVSFRLIIWSPSSEMSIGSKRRLHCASAQKPTPEAPSLWNYPTARKLP